MMKIQFRERCSDCGVAVGQVHLDNACDVARCLISGHQQASCGYLCGHEGNCVSDVWTGYWPGDVEAAAFGWWSRWGESGGWVRCEADATGAAPDLNRLEIEGRWDPVAQCWRKRS